MSARDHAAFLITVYLRTAYAPTAHRLAAREDLADVRSIVDALVDVIREEIRYHAKTPGAPRPVALRGCDDCSVEPTERHRWHSCPGAMRAVEAECTHGADCEIHPDVNQIHNFDPAGGAS